MGSSRKTVILKVDPQKPDGDLIAYGARIIKRGGIVAFPTETVYGLAANLLDRKAIDRLYEVKRRFRGKPLTVHISDIKMVGQMGCVIPKKAKTLMDKYWPGPLTIILKSQNGSKIGFRMPANKVALDLIGLSEVPVVAPSANISGKAPPKDAKSVLKDFDGKIDAVLDGGRTDVGVESTVVDLTVNPPEILREGAIKRRALLKVLNTR